MVNKILKQWIADQATEHGVNLAEEATCEDLQIVLEALQEALHDAPPDRKPAILRQIDRILAQMEQLGCP